MIVVVGIGADGMAGLAPRRRCAELRRATVVYGSHRQLDLLDDTVTAERRQWPSPMLGSVETLGDIPRATCTSSPAATRCCTGSAAC